MRYVAFDLGDKRTGVAVGDSVTGLSGPVDVIEIPIGERGGEALLDAIIAALESHIGATPLGGRGGPAGEVLIGLPINMDGSEGPRAKSVRAFGGRIGQRCGRVIHFHDERLSSADADWSMAKTGLTHRQKKERRDAIAAAAILRDFLENRVRSAS